MTTIPAGAPYPAKGEWFAYPGGPASLVTAVTVTVTQILGAVVIVGPTSAGVVHIATGLDVYTWSVPDDAVGDYAIVFDGLDSDSDAVQASEIVTVGAPDFTYDVTTPVGEIRMLINDVDPANPIFTDTEISAFYRIEANTVRLGAAQALETMGSNEAMVSKVIRTLDLSVDGTKVSADLRARAAILRATAADFDADGNLFGMDVVDWRPDRFWCGPGEFTEHDWSH